MRQKTTPAIILRRINYGEADRIVSFLTPIGKINALVKGVRRSKSKLAGGIELFSESTIVFMETKGELDRIISTRLNVHWENIVGDLQRMMFGYEAMKLIDQIIEDEADEGYFQTLKIALESLNDPDLPLSGVQVWFYLRLLKLQGRQPNLTSDENNQKLAADQTYAFSPDEMCFRVSPHGVYRAEHIKLLRLLLTHHPKLLSQVKNATDLCQTLAPPLKQCL